MSYAEIIAKSCGEEEEEGEDEGGDSEEATSSIHVSFCPLSKITIYITKRGLFVKMLRGCRMR